MFERCVLDGDPNASYLHDVWASVDRLSEAKEDVILDLSRVDFMDSHSVGAVMTLIERLRLKGLQLKVTGLHGQPLRLFLDLHLVPVSGVASGF
jgi:anti-anti-sigma factor